MSKSKLNLCLTCLSNLEDGSMLTSSLTRFLCDVLHFKQILLKGASKFICRKCYKILIQVKGFYTQLRDVEMYFDNKFVPSSEFIDEVGVPHISHPEHVLMANGGSPQQVPTVDIADHKNIRLVRSNGSNYKSEIDEALNDVCSASSVHFSSLNDIDSHQEPLSTPNEHLNCEDCGEEIDETQSQSPERNNYEMQILENDQPTKKPERPYQKDVWTHKQILSFLSAYTYRRKTMSESSPGPESVWDLVVKDMALDGFQKTRAQIKFKYYNLRRIYIKHKRKGIPNEYRQKRFPYENEFDNLFPDQSFILPASEEDYSFESFSCS